MVLWEKGGSYFTQSKVQTGRGRGREKRISYEIGEGKGQSRACDPQLHPEKHKRIQGYVRLRVLPGWGEPGRRYFRREDKNSGNLGGKQPEGLQIRRGKEKQSRGGK